ncbi:motility associated factor glycosyltransferase family protein [Clostridium ihumii]|uniref:motility associated factor glycosyltransferase family protein n=1 Tax=Clostridium ihumii TaxID=1470356 RepID=UPI003D34E475
MESFVKEYSYDNKEIFRIEKNNRKLYLGSKYNMNDEIALIHKNIKNTPSLKRIIVFGAGNGAWLEGLDDITTGKNILVVEPNRKLYEMFINKKHDVNENYISATCMEYEDYYNNMLGFVANCNVSIFVFSNYDFVYENKFRMFIEKVKLMIIDQKIAENTNKEYCKIWLENYLSNIKYILNADILNKYDNLFKSKPAIVVSAGPSLDKNLKLLKGNEEKFIIIAVGRALKALEKEGIKADFTSVIDGSEKMYEVFKDSLDSNIPLLFNEQTGNKIVKQYKGKKIFFSTREFVNADKEILDCEPISLFQGGSVAHACIDFARVLGCDPVIFIGQDLAYTDDKTHADNSISSFEKNNIDKETDFYIDGIDGGKVRTNYDLNIFKERIEMMIKLYNNTTFINATEGGAHIEGTVVRNLKDVIEEYNEQIDKIVLNKNFKIECSKEEVVKKLNNIYVDLENIIELCNEAKTINGNLIRLYIKNNNKFNKAINRLDEIDVLIKKNRGLTYLFETLMIVIDNNLVNKFSSISEDSEVITDKIKLVSEKGEFLNNEFIKAFTYGKSLIKKYIDELEDV